MDIEEKLRDAEGMNRVLQEQIKKEKQQFSITTYTFLFTVAAIYAFFVGNPEVDSTMAIPFTEVIMQLILSLVCGGMVLGIALIASAISVVTTNEKIIFAVGCAVLILILLL